MKTIALLCDVVFLVWIIFMLVVYPPKWSIVLFSFGLCFLLIINVIAIAAEAKGDDFLSLYFRKKNLEQRLRIWELEKKLK
ncbi:hypothetical protein ACFL0O_06385 [Thermodesulfobacteriota bacterium]